MTESAYDRWKTASPDDEPEPPTPEELDAKERQQEAQAEERWLESRNS